MSKTKFRTLLLFITIMLVYCSSSRVMAQTYEGDYVIKEAADTIGFNYTKIEGDLIFEYNDLESFTGFSSLREISGDLKISRSKELQSIEGLTNLEKIGGDFILEYSKLQVLVGFLSLTEIGGDLKLIWNQELKRIEGLTNLENIGGDFIVEYNNLESFTGFLSLTEIGGDLKIGRNQELKGIEGLINLEKIGGNFVVEYTNFESFIGFSSLTEIGGDLEINYNEELKIIEGLANLKKIGGALNIRTNKILTDIRSFIALENMGNNGGITINRNAELITIEGFDALLNTAGFSIRDNPKLTNITGFSQLEEVTSFMIAYNENLVNLPSFNNLQRVSEGGWTISNNASLKSVEGFVELEEVEGRFSIVEHDNLTMISSFPKLKQVNQDFQIVANAQLVSIKGFDVLADIGLSLSIGNNVLLQELEGFNGLKQMDDPISISSNKNLLYIRGFNQLYRLDILNISQNGSLLQLDAFQNLTEVTNNITIEDNHLEELTVESFGLLEKIPMLNIENNKGLIHLQGFDQLKEVGQELNIVENVQLQSINGFNNLVQTPILRINENGLLESINGFNQLTTINDYIGIGRNTKLHTIEGFEVLTSIGNGLGLSYNSELSDCCVFACLKLAEILPLESIFIEGNAANCNRLVDIQNSCIDSPCSPRPTEPSIEIETIYDSPNNTTVNCQYFWEETLWGDCIGDQNNLITYDYLQDGTIELIANATLITDSFKEKGYWYITQFNTVEETYKKIYTSGLWEQPIDHLAVVDIKADGKDELVIISGNILEVFDLTTLTTIYKKQLDIDIPFFNETAAKYADVDRDGQGELIVMMSDQLLFFNDVLELQQQYSVENANFDIGNVDDDPLLEIVFTNGDTFEFKEGNLTKEYDFKPGDLFEDALIILEDTDNDTYQEAVIASSHQRVVIYDIELETPKLEIEANRSIDAFTMFDIDGDGAKEIIYGEDQWNDIYCYNAQTGALIWELGKADRGATAIAIEDFDGDGDWELAFGASCNSSTPNYLVMYDITEKQEEWRNIVNQGQGTIYDVEIADLDQDGQKEIITLRHNNSIVNKKGALIVYDGQTKEVKYVSEVGENLILEEIFDNFYENYTLEVADYANDGDMDIIVTTNPLFLSIWVIDGQDFSIERNKDCITEEDIVDESFYTLKVEDLDQDGNVDLIAGGNNRWYTFSMQDLRLKQQSETFGINGGEIQSLEVGNIDADENQEVVVCKSYIYLFNSNAEIQKQSLGSDYTTLALIDWDNSGDLEIAAGLKNGEVHILDENLDVLESFTLTDQIIDGIEVVDFNEDGEEELLIATDGRLYMISQNGQVIRSQQLGTDVGKFDAIHIEDYDEDGSQNILVGAGNGLFDLDPSCVDCLWFDVSISTKDATCGLENGVIKGLDITEDTYLQWGGTNFTDSISNLAAGVYDVRAVNDKGCNAGFEVELKQWEIIAEAYTTNNPCFGDTLGDAIIEIQNGMAPFSYNWSNGTTRNSVGELMAGDYIVTVSDYTGCALEVPFTITEPDSLKATWYLTNNEEGTRESDWTIHIDVEGGTPNYDYLWDNDWWGSATVNTGDGTYNVTITDYNNCQTEIFIDVHNYTTSVPLLDDYTLKTYPNPAIDQLHLAYNGSNPINTIQLVNIQGQEQAIFPIDQVEYVQNDLITLQLPQVQAGIYFLLLQIGEDWYAKKIVVGE